MKIVIRYEDIIHYVLKMPVFSQVN